MTKYILEYFLPLKWKLHSLACVADSLEGLHPDCSSSSSRETYPVATHTGCSALCSGVKLLALSHSSYFHSGEIKGDIKDPTVVFEEGKGSYPGSVVYLAYTLYIIHIWAGTDSGCSWHPFMLTSELAR